jgi:hypothetical protein
MSPRRRRQRFCQDQAVSSHCIADKNAQGSMERREHPPAPYGSRLPCAESSYPTLWHMSNCAACHHYVPKK